MTMSDRQYISFRQRLIFYRGVGAWTMRGFKKNLARMIEVETKHPYQHTEAQARFLASPALKDFCVHNVPHRWRMVATQGGVNRPLPGEKTRNEALDWISRGYSNLQVIHVDDNIFTIFVKVP